MSTGTRPSGVRVASLTTSYTFFRWLGLISASNAGAAGNSCSSAWLSRWFIAPPRFAATGRPGLESRPERDEPLVQLQVVRRVQRTGHERIEAIGGVEVVLNPLAEHAPLVLQKRLGRLPVLRGEVVGVLAEPLAGQDVLQDDEQAQVLLGVLAEERRDPAEGLRAVRVRLPERLELAQVVAWARGPARRTGSR